MNNHSHLVKCRKRPRLLPKHTAELETSGLSPETIRANNLYSESDPAALAKLLNCGTPRAGRLGPALVYPHHDREGRPLGHATVKPDNPRDRRDKPGKIKYENPCGKPNRLYIPAGARAALTNTTVELFITEGCKKALAATQYGFSCVSLPGVWGWCPPRPKKKGKKVGSLTLNCDLAAVPWKGRRVYIVYDSDCATNANVAKAEKALAAVLAGAGAAVIIVRLPPEPDGAKNGLDDFLRRHGPEKFRQLIAAACPAAESEGGEVDPTQFTESGYSATDGATYHCVLARDVATPQLSVKKKTKLGNFVARITGQTIHDDGAEQTREFAITVESQSKPAAVIHVPVERFTFLDWVVERLGPTYVIQAGGGRRDHLRCAIQEMSGDDIPSVTVFTRAMRIPLGEKSFVRPC